MSSSIDHQTRLLTIYDTAMPEVYRFIRARVRDQSSAEELTADTFLAALGQIRRGALHEVSTAWLIGIARHKVVDHWRRIARQPLVDSTESFEEGVGEFYQRADDPWDAVLDHRLVLDVFELLGDHHRAALTLRYLLGLTVAEVATELGRTVHATEALLVRARRAFRNSYEGSNHHD